MRIRLLTIAISLISITSFANQQVTAISSNVEISPLAQQQKLQNQRMIYQKINQFLDISQSEKTLVITHQLLEKLKDYPLYTYAEYRLLSAKISHIDFSEILVFQKNNPHFYKMNTLKRLWLNEQYSQKNWQNIIENKANLPIDTASQCIIQDAEYMQQEISEKKTALNTKDNKKLDLSQLWLTGESLPSACDPLLEKWFEQGGLTEELTKKRALLAFEKNNTGLLKHLSLQATDPNLRDWLSDLNDLRRYPKFILNAQNQFSIERLSEKDPLSQTILVNIFPSFIRVVDEKDLNKANPFSPFEKWAIRFNLTSQQIQQWKSLLLTHIFDSEDVQVQKWRDKTLLSLKNDNLLERRIRVALREKTDIFPWLNELSEKTKHKDEWQYWLAKHWQKKGKKTKAKTLFKKLQENARGFYPMLAAQELNVVYQPLIKKPSTENTQKMIKAFMPTLQRIEELYYFEDQYNITQEWLHLLEQTDFSGKLALAQYAANKQWFDLQVEATIKAKAWDYLALRLPNAYQDWFDLLLKDQKINRTFAMAIARQESAWRPNVSSHADARGLMQLLPSTAKLTAQRQGLPYNNERQLFDPFDNIMLGTQHLQELYDKFGNNRILIAAAYNAGAHRVTQWLDRSQGKLTMAEFIATIPYYETRGYVQNVLAYDYYYQILQGKKLEKFSQEEKNRLY